MKVLVAGAAGTLGGLVVAELRARRVAVRAMVRRLGALAPADDLEVCVADAMRPESLRGICDGVDAVVSSIGASVDPSPFRGWRSFTRVDAPANRALLAEARRAGVRRFVYTSLIGGDTSRHLDYAEGHERVVDALRDAGIAGAVLRPTGFFVAMRALVGMARRGVVPVFGDGRQPTNPIDERDLAAIAADEAMSQVAGLREVPAGGPEVFTRLQIAELAFSVLGKRPRLLHVPSAVATAVGHAMRLVNPRGAHFLLFANHVMTHPCLAPQMGRRRLLDAFRAEAGHAGS